MTSLDTLQTALKLLSDPTRLRLVALLSEEELAVHELVSITGLAQSRISNHLSLLKRSHLATDRREGNWCFYRLAESAADAGLSADLFQAVVHPYLASESGRSDRQALEAVREQRRERSRAAHDALAERWSEVGHEFAHGSLRAEAWASLAPRQLVVADLGCGDGFLTHYLGARCAKVIAVDHSSNMLDAARRREVASAVEFRQGELDDLPLEAGEVDAAMANLVWHHLADIDRAAVELARIVRPGGTAVITDLLPHDAEWMREALGDLRLGMRPDVVVAALARAGFVDITTEDICDRYIASDGNGRSLELPMFLVRGTRASD